MRTIKEINQEIKKLLKEKKKLKVNQSLRLKMKVQ